MAELIQVPFGLWTWVHPRYHVWWRCGFCQITL